MKTTMAMVALTLALAAGSAAQACDMHQAAPQKAPEQKATETKAAEVVCPVMGGKVADITTAPKSVYQGTTYYFCCPGCKPQFDKDPAKYVKPAAAKAVAEVKCPVMGGKVADVKKAPKSSYRGETYYFCCPGCKPEFDKDPAKYAKVTPKTEKKAPKTRKPMPNPMEPMPGHHH